MLRRMDDQGLWALARMDDAALLALADENGDGRAPSSSSERSSSSRSREDDDGCSVDGGVREHESSAPCADDRSAARSMQCAMWLMCALCALSQHATILG